MMWIAALIFFSITGALQSEYSSLSLLIMAVRHAARAPRSQEKSCPRQKWALRGNQKDAISGGRATLFTGAAWIVLGSCDGVSADCVVDDMSGAVGMRSR